MFAEPVGRGCWVGIAKSTQRPDPAVSTATTAIAPVASIRSASTPTSSPPTANPISRQNRYTPTIAGRATGVVASETAAIRVG